VHAQFDPLYDLQHVESSLVCKHDENQSISQQNKKQTKIKGYLSQLQHPFPAIHQSRKTREMFSIYL